MKKKILILSLIIMLIISFIPVVSSAANYSFTVSMTAKNAKVSSGSGVIITVKLSNLNVGENGINSFSAYLSYDTDIFEPLTDSSIDGLNGWVPSYTTGTGKVSLYRPTFLKSDEEIMTIELKTKSGLADGTQGEVKLSTIKVSNSSDEITASPVSTNITIGTESTQVPVENVVTPIPITPENIVTPTPAVNNTLPVNNTSVVNKVANNVTTNKVQVVNKSNNDMPYTGTDSNSLAKIIIGIICLSLVIYLKIERMDKDIK